jgi:hypothetical protein
MGIEARLSKDQAHLEFVLEGSQLADLDVCKTVDDLSQFIPIHLNGDTLYTDKEAFAKRFSSEVTSNTADKIQKISDPVQLLEFLAVEALDQQHPHEFDLMVRELKSKGSDVSLLIVHCFKHYLGQGNLKVADHLLEKYDEALKPAIEPLFMVFVADGIVPAVKYLLSYPKFLSGEMIQNGIQLAYGQENAQLLGVFYKVAPSAMDWYVRELVGDGEASSLKEFILSAGQISQELLVEMVEEAAVEKNVSILTELISYHSRDGNSGY